MNAVDLKALLLKNLIELAGLSFLIRTIFLDIVALPSMS